MESLAVECKRGVTVRNQCVLMRGVNDSVETMTRAYGVKILGVIQKPITPEKLAALIKLHLPAQESPLQASPEALCFDIDEIVAGIRNDEFEPFFQPKVELASGRIKGAEALARQGVLPGKRPDAGGMALILYGQQAGPAAFGADVEIAR